MTLGCHRLFVHSCMHPSFILVSFTITVFHQLVCIDHFFIAIHSGWSALGHHFFFSVSLFIAAPLWCFGICHWHFLLFQSLSFFLAASCFVGFLNSFFLHGLSSFIICAVMSFFLSRSLSRLAAWTSSTFSTWWRSLCLFFVQHYVRQVLLSVLHQSSFTFLHPV